MAEAPGVGQHGDQTENEFVRLLAPVKRHGPVSETLHLEKSTDHPSLHLYAAVAGS